MASLPVSLLLAVLFVQAAADITNTRVTSGQCVCVQGTGVNVRSGPGLSHPVTTSVSTGSCFTVTGRSQDANGYKWFEASISGQNRWIAGNFLNTAAASQCSSGGSSSGSDSCNNPTAKSLACELLGLYNSGKIGAASVHVSGYKDSAYAINNIRDTCNGNAAHRSSYRDPTCAAAAPGGTVCLSSKLLQYLVNLAKGGFIYINEIAGGCHSATSRHYRGLAVDLRNRDGRNAEYLRLCTSMGGNYCKNEGSHIHADFN